MANRKKPILAETSRVTMRDVAQKLGVSHVAVSLALRDRPGVSPDLKKRVKATAKAMGYRPEPMARALAVYRHNKRAPSVHAAIAWLNSWEDPARLRSFREFDAYWRGASEAATAAGYYLEEFVHNKGMPFSRIQTILLTRNIRGVIIPPQPTRVEWDGLDWNNFSVVRIGHSQPEPEVYMVSPDQVGNGLLAYQKIKESGYGRIGYISNRWALGRWWGAGGVFLAQYLDSSAQRVPPLILESPTGVGDRNVIEGWLKRHQPEAILTEIANMKSMLEQLGKRVPQDIALASINVLDSEADSGINQNPELVGKAAAEVLVAMINRNERGISLNHRSATVMGRWVKGSTLPVRTPRKPAG